MILRIPEDLGLLLSLLGQQDCLNVGQYSSLGNGDSGKKFVELLVVSDGKLKVSRNDPGLLVVSSSVSCQLKNFSSQVFQDGCQVYWGSGSYSFGEVTLSKKSMDSSDRELKSCSR